MTRLSPTIAGDAIRHVIQAQATLVPAVLVPSIACRSAVLQAADPSLVCCDFCHRAGRAENRLPVDGVSWGLLLHLYGAGPIGFHLGFGIGALPFVGLELLYAGAGVDDEFGVVEVVLDEMQAAPTFFVGAGAVLRLRTLCESALGVANKLYLQARPARSCARNAHP